MMIYETERLVVRDWTESAADLGRVFDIYSRWEVARWLGAQPRALEDRAEAAEMVRRWHARYAADAGRYGAWAIEVRATGHVAGTVLLKALPGAENEATSDIEVGWHLHPDSWGQGYATEAARGAVQRAFAGGLAEIYAVVKPGNEPSMAVARRLGMMPLGRKTRWYGGVELESFVLPRA